MSSALSLRHHFMRLPRKFAILLNVTIKNIQNAFHALNIGMVIYILHDLSGLLSDVFGIFTAFLSWSSLRIRNQAIMRCYI